MITRGDLAYPGFVMSGISTVFEDTFYEAQRDTQWQEIASRAGVTTPIVKYPFLGANPHFKKFRDRVDDQGVAPYLVTIEDEEWDINMRISAKAIEDDATGMYKMRAAALGESAAWFDDEKAFGLLDGSFTGIGYDGQAMVSASHQSGASPTQSNYTNASLSATSLAAAVGTGGNFKDDTNRPFGTVFTTLAVGPLLETRALELVNSPIVVNLGNATGSAATPYGNVLQGRFKVVVSPWVSSYHWFLVDSRKRVKPIIIQDREDVPLQTWDDTDDPRARRNREYNFTGFMRRGYGYGPWQTLYGSNATS
jgi:phage major head subunit gpT-like protein